MTLLASAYFAAYLSFSAWTITSDLRRTGRLKGDTTAEIPMDLLILPSALAYWFPSVRGGLGDFLLPMYCGGLAALLALLCLAVRRSASDTGYTDRENFWLAVAGVFLVLVLASPALIWGFLAAVLGRGA